VYKYFFFDLQLIEHPYSEVNEDSKIFNKINYRWYGTGSHL